MIITEYELRSNWHKDKEKEITIPEGSIITPAALDFLRQKGIRVKHEATKTVSTQRALKPEHMTHSYGSNLVNKTDPVIALRGQLDLFTCELVEVQTHLRIGEDKLLSHLEEIGKLVRDIMVAEVTKKPLVFTGLMGLTPDQLREYSHYPEKYFGIKHSLPDYRNGQTVARLNLLRAKIREVELYANRVFTDTNGQCIRNDIIIALNRLSSALYILVCQQLAKENKIKKVLIGVSNRHCHLSKKDLERLFGNGYELSIMKTLRQPGQFAAKETVTIKGPKGFIERVRIVGPPRDQTQVEVSGTDCILLGVEQIVRESGCHEGTGGVTIIGPQGRITLEKGLFVAARHLHMNYDQAVSYGLKNGQKVSVRVNGSRPVIFEDVLVRAGSGHEMELHLDTDEANAAILGENNYGIIVEGDQ